MGIKGVLPFRLSSSTPAVISNPVIALISQSVRGDAGVADFQEIQSK